MKTSESTDSLLAQILERLTELVGLTATQGKSKNEQVSLLVGQGFSNAQISKLLGIPKGTVDTIRAQKKKEKTVKKQQEPANGA